MGYKKGYKFYLQFGGICGTIRTVMGRILHSIKNAECAPVYDGSAVYWTMILRGYRGEWKIENGDSLASSRIKSARCLRCVLPNSVTHRIGLMRYIN